MSNVICGNFSISLEKMKGRKNANLFKCIMCKAVPFRIPLEATCCKEVYCSECYHEWKKISNSCFGSTFDQCHSQLDGRDIHGFKEQVWKSLEASCNICELSFAIEDIYKHEFFCCIPQKKTKKRKLDLSESQQLGDRNYCRSLKDFLEPIRRSVLEFIEENPDAQDRLRVTGPPIPIPLVGLSPLI